MVNDLTQRKMPVDPNRNKSFASYFNDMMEKQNKNTLIADHLQKLKANHNTSNFATP